MAVLISPALARAGACEYECACEPCGRRCRRYLAGKTREKEKKSEKSARSAALGNRGEKLHRKGTTDRREKQTTWAAAAPRWDTCRPTLTRIVRFRSRHGVGEWRKVGADFPFPNFSLILNLLSLRLLFPRFISSLSTANQEDIK